MSTELQRQALARDLARRLQLASHDEIRVVDRVLQRLELGRERYGLLDLAKPRDYRRERFEERLDALVYDVCEELALEDQHRAGLREEARVEMLGGPVDIRDLAIEIAQRGSKTMPLSRAERMDRILRAAQAGAITREAAKKMLAASEERDVTEAARHRAELLEWQADQHATRASDVPARIAAADLDEDEPYAGFEIGGEGG